MSLKGKFEAYADALPSVQPQEIEQYDAYFTLLKEWNEKINLVSRKSIDSSFEYHIADSLHLSQFISEQLNGRSYSDLGTGAGFPGLIFAIRYPQVKVTFFEKLQKRRIFLEDIKAKLSLKNVTVEGALADRSKDLFTARAVLAPDELLAFMKRMLQVPGGIIVSLGGVSDWNRTPKGFERAKAISYDLPGEAGTRKAVLFERST